MNKTLKIINNLESVINKAENIGNSKIDEVSKTGIEELIANLKDNAALLRTTIR